MEKAIYKILRTESIGIIPNCNHNVKYLGKSRVDGYPLFEVEYDSHNANYFFNCSPYEILRGSVIVNTKPGYTLMANEIERVEKSPFLESDQVKPMPLPTGMLFYLDYVYDNKDYDERLLLMF